MSIILALAIQISFLFGVPAQSIPAVLVSHEKSPYYSIYDPKKDIIVVFGEDNLKSGILAHELAHSIINKTMGSVPSKTQEILAGYAEYEMNKAFGNVVLSMEEINRR